MRFALADPPYPGMAHLYKNHPDYAGEVDHKMLIERLVAEYPDGWALSTAASTLQSVLALCPPVRTLVWCINNSQYCPPNKLKFAWQPLILSGGRVPQNVTNDYFVSYSPKGFLSDSIGFDGNKPIEYCFWLFRCLGALPGDTLADLYPGSGAVSRAWDNYQRQIVLPFGGERPKQGRLAVPE